MRQLKRKENEIVLPELLAPAGTLEKLRMALHYGADAVYLGAKDLSLRAKAGNFTFAEMEEGVRIAHDQGAKVYVTVNALVHNRDLIEIDTFLEKVAEKGIDGIIVSDPGIITRALKVVPQVPVHLSTQANVTNHLAADFWFASGAARLNLARELSLEEIRQIRGHVNGELEVFVHGAVCISYSGRCMLSNYLTGRDANRGICSHPCRFKYAVMEEKRPGQYFPVEEDGRGTYIFNSKDLCLLRLLPKLVAAGVDSLKIEGRMKSIFYVGGVVRIYRAALDYLGNLPADAWERPERIVFPEELFVEIEKTGTRGITENFAEKVPDAKDMLYESSRAEQMVEPVAVMKSNEQPLVEIRNRVEVGEVVEHMGRGMQTTEMVISEMRNEKNELLKVANPGNCVTLVTHPRIVGYEKWDMLRRQKLRR